MSGADPALLAGLRLLRARAWFEAHEALEDLWREHPEGQRREALQALIQHAVALEHLARGNALGAFNVWSRAKARAKKLPGELEGIDLAGWGAALERFYAEVDLAQRVRGQLEGGVAAGEAHIELPPLPPAATWPNPPLSEEIEAQL